MTKMICDDCGADAPDMRPLVYASVKDGNRLIYVPAAIADRTDLCPSCLARALREAADKLEPKQDLVHRALHCAHCGVDHSPSISCDDVSRPMHPDPNVAWSVPYNG